MIDEFGIIYCVTNDANNKSYIGQAIDFERRKNQHIYYAKNNKDNTYFHRAIRKYGIDNFKWEILCECSSKDELDKKEQYYIKELNTKSPTGYNLTDGGYGNSGYKVPIETKSKISESLKGHAVLKDTKAKLCEKSKGNTSHCLNYEIIYPNGEIKIICGLKKWCNENGFNYKGVNRASRNNKPYKDHIINKL